MLKQRPAFWIFPVLIAFACLALPTFSVASEITDDLKATIDEVIKIVTDESLKNDPVKRRAMLRTVTDKRFNYEFMAMKTLDKAWGIRTPEERKQFTLIFKKLLENMYAGKLEAYRDEKIEYVKEEKIDRFAVVSTKVIRRDAEIDVNYKLFNANGSWKIIDFKIENVSMVDNFKAQFTKIIRKKKYEGLVTKLQDKLKDLELNGGASDTL